VLSALVILALSGPAVTHSDSKIVVTQEMVDLLNQRTNSWTASLDWVGDMTIGEARTIYAATEIRETREFPEHNWGALLDYMANPAAFDTRTQWPKCVLPIQNQDQCGSCWAFGAAEALSVRICIAKGTPLTLLSPQYLVSCDTTSYGCDGGYPDLAWKFMSTNGVPSWACVPYTSGNGKSNGTCPKTCTAAGQTWSLSKATSVKSYSGAASIQAALMANGPVEVSFTVYQDFMSYTGGIYKHTTGANLGGHAVMAVGWGNQNGVNYWICANSWGASWGIQGYFWIAFGQCFIDYEAVAGLAD